MSLNTARRSISHSGHKCRDRWRIETEAETHGRKCPPSPFNKKPAYLLRGATAKMEFMESGKVQNCCSGECNREFLGGCVYLIRK